MAERLSARLARLFEDYCRHHGLKESTVGLNVMRDPRLYAKIKSNSGAFSVHTYDKVVAWFAADWPAELDWPKGIWRPQVEPRQPTVRKRKRRAAKAAAPPACACPEIHFGWNQLRR